jgi:zinc protease
LENGLNVLLKPVRTSSAVSTWMFYRVGSRNERPGITGASHWCEHMMFKGGGRLGKGEVHNLVSAEGGRNNAFTDHDLTAYYETLPKQKLDTALFIESERMSNSAFAPEEVESERQVIISEREGAENYPAYQVREEIYATAFRNHPYRWPVVGWKQDLQQMTRDELYEHYKKFYNPNNATLVVCGNFDVGEASDKIADAFSNIGLGEKFSGKISSREQEQKGERTSKIIQPGTIDYVGAAYRIPEITHEDIPSLMVLSAVLGGWRGLIGFFGDRFVPRTNRLYRKLVEGKIASEVNTYFPVNADPCLLYFELMLIPGVTTLRAKDELFSEIQKIEDVPPSEDEMRVASNQIRSWHAYENDGISLQALSIGFMHTMGDKDLSDKLVEESLRIRPEGVQKAATRYFSEKNRVVCEYQSVGR